VRPILPEWPASANRKALRELGQLDGSFLQAQVGEFCVEFLGQDPKLARRASGSSTTGLPSGAYEFLVAAVVPAIVDEFLGGGELVLRGFPRILQFFIPRSAFRSPRSKKPCSIEMDVGCRSDAISPGCGGQRV
jgi:hypothetical protein